MHRDDNHRYKFIATSYEEIAKQYQRSINMPMGAMVLKLMEHYIYKYPEEWYQWKKYQGLDVFAPSGADVKIPASVPVLKPSLI
jgi:hypothetical protein